jgi:hypothetical protein
MRSKILPAAVILAGLFATTTLFAQPSANIEKSKAAPTSSGAEKPYQVEWVYRVRYGFQKEWWRLFKKYEIAVLDREQELGYVTSYTVHRPGLHTSEDSRWDYRIVINYKNFAASRHGHEVEQALFPDTATLDREQERRWELTANHWDLPIREIDPHE